MNVNLINIRGLFLLTFFALFGTRHIVSCQHINEFHRVVQGAMVWGIGAGGDSICQVDNEEDTLQWTHTKDGDVNVIYASDGSVETARGYSVLPHPDSWYSLQINTVDGDTIGIYTCSTTTAASSIPNPKTVASVDFLGISGDLPDPIANGQRVTMMCARSEPDDILTWTFVSSLLGGGQSTIYDSTTNDVDPHGYTVDVGTNDYDRPLTITSMSQTHSGSYTCTVRDTTMAVRVSHSREVSIGGNDGGNGNGDDGPNAAQYLKPKEGLIFIALFTWFVALL